MVEFKAKNVNRYHFLVIGPSEYDCPFFLSLSAHIPRLVLSVQGHQTFAQQKTSTKSKKKENGIVAVRIWSLFNKVQCYKLSDFYMEFAMN